VRGVTWREFEALCSSRMDGRRPSPPSSTIEFLERCAALGLLVRTQDRSGTRYAPTPLLSQVFETWD